MVRGNDHAQSGLVIFGRQIPVVCPGKLGIAHSVAGVGHPLQAQIRSICQDGRKDRMRVFMLLAGAKVAERAQEPGALGHFDHEFGDAHARKQGVKLAIEGFRLGRRNRLHRLQLKPVALERHALEPVRLDLLGEAAQPPVERSCPLLQIGGCIGLEWQAVSHLTGLASAQQIGVEAAIIAGSFDPNIARAQPVAQRGENGGGIVGHGSGG